MNTTNPAGFPATHEDKNGTADPAVKAHGFEGNARKTSVGALLSGLAIVLCAPGWTSGSESVSPRGAARAGESTEAVRAVEKDGSRPVLEANQGKSTGNVDAIMANAENAPRLDSLAFFGFYTGMSVADAKTLREHYGLDRRQLEFFFDKQTGEVVRMRFTPKAITTVMKAPNNFPTLELRLREYLGIVAWNDERRIVRDEIDPVFRGEAEKTVSGDGDNVAYVYQTADGVVATLYAKGWDGNERIVFEIADAKRERKAVSFNRMFDANNAMRKRFGELEAAGREPRMLEFPSGYEWTLRDFGKGLWIADAPVSAEQLALFAGERTDGSAADGAENGFAAKLNAGPLQAVGPDIVRFREPFPDEMDEIRREGLSFVRGGADGAVPTAVIIAENASSPRMNRRAMYVLRRSGLPEDAAALKTFCRENGGAFDEPSTTVFLPVETPGARELAAAERRIAAAADRAPGAVSGLIAGTVPIPGRGFRMGKREVTQAEWEAVMGGNPAQFKGADRPVERVSWFDCQMFLKKLNELPAAKESGLAFRLPTEEEWTFACRAGATGPYCRLADGTEIAEETLAEVAWFKDDSDGETHPAGTKKPNAFGLHDMHGNVAEWTSTADDGDFVLGGGSFYNPSDSCRTGRPLRIAPGHSDAGLGFRLCAEDERIAAERRVKERIAAERRAEERDEEERRAEERAERERLAREKAEAERQEREEAERLAREKAEAERREREARAEAERRKAAQVAGLIAGMVRIPGRNCMMGKTEVTQAQWEAVTGSNPSKFKGPDNPVETVSWDDCQEFLKTLNALPAVKDSGLTFRLPSEEEWQYACHAGATGRYCKLANGTEISEKTLDQVAWFENDAGGETHPVGQKQPNAFGLHDMNGNVWEWTSTAVGEDRVNRGGSWCDSAERCGSSYRRWYSPSNRYYGLGFRLCADVSNHAIAVRAPKMAEKPWDTIFWFKSATAFKPGDRWEVSMRIKADKKAEGSQAARTDTHAGLDKLISATGIGDVPFGTEWSVCKRSGTFVNDQEGGNFITFALNYFPDANVYYFDDISFKINGREMIVNGDCEGSNWSSFWVREGGWGHPGKPISAANVVAVPVWIPPAAPAAQNHAIVLKSQKKVKNPWDTEFWFKSAATFKAGDKWEVSMKVKAGKGPGSITTQFQTEPGKFITSNAIGNVPFGTEWSVYKRSGTFGKDQEGGSSISFHLNHFPEANVYYFDDISFKINGRETIVNGNCEGSDWSSFVAREGGWDQPIQSISAANVVAVP